MKATREDLVRIRYLQLGKYRVTLTGNIESWSGSQIGFYDINKRYHKLSLENVLRIEPTRIKHVNTEKEMDESSDQDSEQASLDDYLK
jgi:hypothetical protein